MCATVPSLLVVQNTHGSMLANHAAMTSPLQWSHLASPAVLPYFPIRPCFFFFPAFSLSIFHTHAQSKRHPSSMHWLQTLCTEGLLRGSKLENNHMLSWATPPLPVTQFPREPFKNLSSKTGSHPRPVIHPALTLTGSNTRRASLWGTIGNMGKMTDDYLA